MSKELDILGRLARRARTDKKTLKQAPVQELLLAIMNPGFECKRTGMVGKLLAMIRHNTDNMSHRVFPVERGMSLTVAGRILAGADNRFRQGLWGSEFSTGSGKVKLSIAGFGPSVTMKYARRHLVKKGCKMPTVEDVLLFWVKYAKKVKLGERFIFLHEPVMYHGLEMVLVVNFRDCGKDAPSLTGVYMGTKLEERDHVIVVE